MISTSGQFNVRNVYRTVVSNNQTEALVSVFGFAFCFLFKGRTLTSVINAYYAKFVSKNICNYGHCVSFFLVTALVYKVALICLPP